MDFFFDVFYLDLKKLIRPISKVIIAIDISFIQQLLDTEINININYSILYFTQGSNQTNNNMMNIIKPSF